MHQDELQVDESMAFQRREWAAQRLGWWLLGLFVTAATVGLFGKGPASYAEAGDPADPVWIEYERFVRVGSSSRIVLHHNPAPHVVGAREVRISRMYYDTVRVEHVHPEPLSTHLGPDIVTMRFEAATGAHSIVLDVEPLLVGYHRGAFAVDGAAPLQISHFAFF